MAGMFYSLQEVAKKLSKTEKEIKELVKTGKLREFRDGPNLLFKVDEVESLATAMGATASKKPSAESPKQVEDEISIAPEQEETSAESELTAADTSALGSEGITVIGEKDTDYKATDDTMAETQAVSGATSFLGELKDAGKTGKASDEAALEQIEEDVSLDSFGSGSGLLDLSLQADDTSLGGILDEIYTTEGEGKGEGKKAGEPAEAMEAAAAEAEQIIPEASVTPELVMEEIPAMVQVYAEPDKTSNAFGIMLIVPLLVTVYATIVALAGQKNIIPSILKGVQNIIWYIMLALAVVSGLIVGVPALLGGTGSKAEKKPKEKKEKKSKKKKKAEEAPEPEVKAETPQAESPEIPESATPEAELPEMELPDMETPESEGENNLKI